LHIIQEENMTFKTALIAAGLALSTLPAAAQDVITYTVDENFDDLLFSLENAIIDRGLNIDGHSHVGDMLERTKGDVGSDVTIFSHADVLSFCSADVSRQVMEADHMNVMFCPYDIFVFALPGEEGKSTIGFRTYPEGAMQMVQNLLDEIARDAAGIEE
jgi:uncharacterized protein (DUF302 family)